MYYKDAGFRALYHQFVVFPIDVAGDAVKQFPGYDQANSILTYGYIDREAGLTMEALALGRIGEDSGEFFDGLPEDRVFIRLGAVREADFEIMEPAGIEESYADKIRMLDAYKADPEIEESRTLTFLDAHRHPAYIDDVLVELIMEGMETEKCWARIQGLSKPAIRAKLLNEPHQDFPVHKGDDFYFVIHKESEDSFHLLASFNTEPGFTKEILEDGTLLKEAIHLFNTNHSDYSLFRVLSILRDSDVWIPCNAVLSEADQKAFEEVVRSAGDDLESLKGMTLSNQDNIRLIPDLLKNEDGMFFPVFSSCEEMGEYGNGFSKLGRSFEEAIRMAQSHKEDILGIVVNAFSESFFVPRELFDKILSVESRLEEQKGNYKKDNLKQTGNRWKPA